MFYFITKAQAHRKQRQNKKIAKLMVEQHLQFFKQKKKVGAFSLH